ncbi:MAG: 2'-5' RNA ligase [SAR202 cluster bacterium Io17-Chloro-G3]|nr:MAG: 2'-5' RNA ligase [SAR202 cluster bacterium Io17-Chloro-G3]
MRKPLRVNPLRLFLAFELTKPARKHINQLLDLLRQKNLSGFRLAKRNNVHMTLKFLGNVPRECIPEITSGMEEAVKNTAAFTLEIQGLGAFPSLSSPRILWSNVHGELDTLLQLHKRLEDVLEAKGFPREQRPYFPHLTLARRQRQLCHSDLQHLKSLVVIAQAFGRKSLLISKLSLMQSTLSWQGAVYTRKASVSLPSPFAE